MEHEPCGFLADADGARQFIAADPVLRIGNQPHGEQPLVEADGAVLHDGADLDRELPLRVLFGAFPQAASRNERHPFGATGRATDRTPLPAQFHHFREAGVRVREVDHGFLEGAGKGLSCHAEKSTETIYLSQVN